MKSETSPSEYWAEMANEIGEEIRAYALAQLVAADAPAPSGMFSPKYEWALVFISDTTLYIERGASQNWFERLVTSRKAKEDPERVGIPLSAVRRVTLPPARKGLMRFLASPEIHLEVAYDGSPGILRLILDRRGQNDQVLIDLLSRAAQENA